MFSLDAGFIGNILANSLREIRWSGRSFLLVDEILGNPFPPNTHRERERERERERHTQREREREREETPEFELKRGESGHLRKTFVLRNMHTSTEFK